MEKDFAKDENDDMALLREAMKRTDTYDEMAKWLSSAWQRKYASEFRGNMSLSYDLVDEQFTLKCGDKVMMFDEDDIENIPKQLTFLRRSK